MHISIAGTAADNSFVFATLDSKIPLLKSQISKDTLPIEGGGFLYITEKFLTGFIQMTHSFKALTIFLWMHNGQILYDYLISFLSLDYTKKP